MTLAEFAVPLRSRRTVFAPSRLPFAPFVVTPGFIRRARRDRRGLKCASLRRFCEALAVGDSGVFVGF